MKDKDRINPPVWAQRFLEWYCRPELLEDLQGDLNEYFDRNIKAIGPTRARIIYAIDVFKFLRLYTVRKPEFINLLIHGIMIGSYIKTSGRSIMRNKLFSFINIAGLAVSMSVGLLMISVLHDIFSYDQFNQRHDRIYRVISQYQYLDHKDGNYMATTSMLAGKSIRENITGPEDVAILHQGFNGDLKFNEKTIPLNGFWANESLFTVFSFDMIKGNSSTALKAPFSVVLTETSAKKIFGNEDAFGKVVRFNNDREFTVTGIMRDVPVFSHVKFDMLGSLSSRETTEKDNKDELAWSNIWSTWVYVLMPEQANLVSFQKNLDDLSAEKDKTVKNTKIKLALQPLDNIMTGENMGNRIGPTLGSTALWIFGGLSFVVLLSACFNYTNLSVARSLKRSREVGIRKVIGALKRHVMMQFVVEAIIISLLALVFGFGLFIVLRPYLLGLEPEIQKVLVLNLSSVLILYFIGFAIVIGIMAGILPALFFSRMDAVKVLKDLSVARIFRKLTMRKVLIVFQYTISIIFITSTLIIYKQYKHLLAYDLGFTTENILNIRIQGNKAELLKKDLQELPEVKDISQSSMITSVGNYWGTTVLNPDNPTDSTGVWYTMIDDRYVTLHNHQLLAGKNFIPKSAESEETEVIVNERMLKRFNVAKQDPAKAIGETLKMDGKKVTIIGVLKDFEYGKVDNNKNSKEVMFRYSSDKAEYLNVKLQSGDLLSTFSKIEAIWKKHDDVHPFDAKFYDDEIAQAFSGFSAAVKVAGFLAFLVICIASMGLLGMVIFTTETKLKEISIRKVLGASEGGLIYMLGKGFFLLLGIAASIALPVTYFIFDKFILTEIDNHLPITGLEMFAGVVAVLMLASLIIGSQTLKIARTNPAEVLKGE